MWYVYANVLSYRHTKHIIMNTIFGYWRCSTDAQDQERQIRALKDAGCEVIWVDRVDLRLFFQQKVELVVHRGHRVLP